MFDALEKSSICASKELPQMIHITRIVVSRSQVIASYRAQCEPGLITLWEYGKLAIQTFKIRMALFRYEFKEITLKMVEYQNK